MELNIIATIIVAFTVWFVFWLDRQSINWLQKFLNWFPPILFAYVVPALFTHVFKINLSKVDLHQLSRNIIIPLTILLVMSSLSIKQLMKVGSKPIILFVIGSFVIAVIPPLILLLSNKISPGNWFIPQEYWSGLVPIVGSWIGGSTSQLVLKEIVGCPETLFLSVVVLDNILVNIWTIFMFQAIKKSDTLNELFNIKSPLPVSDPLITKQNDSYKSSYILIASFILVIGFHFITDDFLTGVIVFSILGLMVGNLLPKWNHRWSVKAGAILILVIMSILGLRLDFAGLSLPLSFVLFCIVWLITHYIILVLAARIMNLHMVWVPISSMANVGGISTAPAVTSAYNKNLMPHAILLAILSMVTGNVWGMLTFKLLNML
jgi:uncharacterized membrane protein